MELIQQMCMLPWIIGIKTHIQSLLHLSLLLNLAVCKTQEKIGHIKDQKDQIQLTTNNTTCIALFQTTMGGTQILILNNPLHRVMKSIRKIKNGKRTFQLDQTQLITSNTMWAAQAQTCKPTQDIIYLLWARKVLRLLRPTTKIRLWFKLILIFTLLQSQWVFEWTVYSILFKQKDQFC